MIPFNVPFASGDELTQISAAIADNKLSGNGHFTKKCKAFFKSNYGFKDTFLTTSCTAAIQMVAIAMALKAGDEIILPSYTFSSTPNPFLIAGATVKFADSEPDHPNVSLASIASLITPKTKAVMVVHYGGYSCDIEGIRALCDQHGLLLIEDAAQCIHGYHKGKPLGSFGDFAVFSFHETKNIHCGEGGLLVVNHPGFVDKAETIWNYGTNKKAFLSGEVDSYEWTGLGLSFCLSEINAAYLYAQLQRVPQVTQRRKALWESYYRALAPLEKLGLLQRPQIAGEESSYHTFYVCTLSRKHYLALQEHLLTNFVLAVQHYYPLHESAFAKSEGLTADLPHASFFGYNLLRLPLFASLTEVQVQQVTQLILDFHKN
ncbi:MAG: dTDP-4-amino-4,6-dideoxygalactose transaminase [Flavobacteriales bacterium]|jgi:dTDP-4-amino-4,6-dideoxygalactose transaminase